MYDTASTQAQNTVAELIADAHSALLAARLISGHLDVGTFCDTNSADTLARISRDALALAETLSDIG